MPDLEDRQAKERRVKLAMTAMAKACRDNGLTVPETVIAAAQFTGLAVANHPIASVHEAHLKVAAEAMRNAHAGYLARRIMV